MFDHRNPEALSTKLIYSYDNKLNQTWNIHEYKTPAAYLDPAKQVKEREYQSLKKGEKNRNYVTKKGFYMDYDIKVAKSIPGPDKYGNNLPWSIEKMARIAKHRKVDQKLIKKTYLEEIEIEQKNRKKPGICSYSLEKSLKEKEKQVELMKKKKCFVAEKHYYHDDTSFLADKSPGSGAYNPHETVDKLKLNKTDYKDWIKKHKDENERDSKKRSSQPAPGSYTPMSSTFTTFESLNSTRQKDSSKSREKSFGFGSDSRFEYTRPVKKVTKEIRPDPISYNTGYEWRKDSKGKPWNEAISKGSVTLSVYH